MRQLTPISVLVLTYNEELNIEACLQSVAEWCQEINIVDSGSTDATLELAAKFSPRVYFHPYVDHSSQLDWALRNVPFACDWLLLLDADNVITSELRSQITEQMSRDSSDAAGYYVSHKYFFLGKPIRGFKPWSLRLFLHEGARIDDSELVDFRINLDGPVGYLSGVMLEYNRKDDDIDVWMDKHQKFSSRLALEEVLRREGYLRWLERPRLTGTHDQRVTWLRHRWISLPRYVRPFIYFAYRYIVGLGFLDGRNGLVYHFLQALWFRLVVDMKVEAIYRGMGGGEIALRRLAQTYREVAHPGGAYQGNGGPSEVVQGHGSTEPRDVASGGGERPPGRTGAKR